MKKLAIIIFVILLTLPAYGQSLVAEADSAYAREDYHRAIELYRRSLQQDGSSETVLFNLGNAYYRTGDVGHAIINYERALMLDPSFSDARQNLNFAKTRIADRPEDDSSFLSNVYGGIMTWTRPSVWAWIAFGCFAATLALLALYVFARPVALRKTGFFGGAVMLVVTIFAITLAFNSARAINRHDYAIVIAPSTNLCSAPRMPKDKTETVVPIHEGTKLQIVDSIATPDDPASRMWYDVKVNNSTRAWVRGSDVERL